MTERHWHLRTWTNLSACVHGAYSTWADYEIIEGEDLVALSHQIHTPDGCDAENWTLRGVPIDEESLAHPISALMHVADAIGIDFGKALVAARQLHGESMADAQEARGLAVADVLARTRKR